MLPFVLIPVCFLVQCQLDMRNIEGAAEHYHWSVTRITWAPLADFMSSARGGRCYWLSYREASGRGARRMCRVSGLAGFGATVAFDRPELEALEERGTGARALTCDAPRLERVQSVIASAFGGLLAGAAIGIGAALCIDPASSLAPAYGALLAGPAGAVIGALFGLLRRR